jgi:predicted dehydrogenase
MKQILQHARTGAITVEEVPAPQLLPGCVLVRVASSVAERYSGDNVVVSLHFSNGSEGTIAYLANGDRSFSKERIEVFGGISVAILDDFRGLELVRNGRKETLHSRWRQDKGHRAEWAAFTQFIQKRREPPIAFEDLVCSTLATLRIDESIATGKRLAVDVAAFLDNAQRTSGANPNPRQ